MHLTQYLSFEITRHCNLGKIHDLCPNRHPERYASVDMSNPIRDDMIVAICDDAYNRYGFQGKVSWHYYSEPLVAEDRMWRLMDAIDSVAPQAEYDLWTNGTIWPKHPENLDRFAVIRITDYLLEDHRVDLEHWVTVKTEITRNYGYLDGRINPPPRKRTIRCFRPYTEMIFDYFGQVHLCCYDWRGLGSPGNIHTSTFPEIIQRWQAIRAIIGRDGFQPEAPAVCQTCPWKTNGLSMLADGPFKAAMAALV